jgi:hypothetical protein
MNIGRSFIDTELNQIFTPHRMKYTQEHSIAPNIALKSTQYNEKGRTLAESS